MLDVLVARIASGFAFFSSAANSARLASTFSKIASMITSARATPSPATSGISRSRASRARRGSFRRSANSLPARFIAGARRSAFWSCSVTVSPRSAHHAAMSPPIVPAPTTCTCVALNVVFLAEPLQALLQLEHADQVRGGRRCAASDGIDAGSPAAAASALPSYLREQLEDRVRRRIVLAARALRDLLLAPAPR